jgi:hypothetical protein
MSESRRSKRFRPSSVAEKLVPILLAVLVIVVLALLGVIPSA